MSVPKLVTIGPPPARAEIVAIIESLLEQAKGGEIVSVTIVAVTRGGDAIADWSQGGDVFREVGALHYAAAEMLAQKRESDAS